MDLVNGILNESLVSELVKALREGNNFSYTKDGVTINANVDKDVINIACSYSTKEDVNKGIREDFYKFCDSMEEELFLEVCESLDDLSEVNQMIEGDEVEEGIEIFMDALNEIVTSKVASCNKEIDNLNKQLTLFKQERDNLLKYMK